MRKVLAILFAIMGGCGDANTVSLYAAGNSYSEQVTTANEATVTFTISQLSISETGENWEIVLEDTVATVGPETLIELDQSVFSAGEYHGVKIELASGIQAEIGDTTFDQDFSDVLMYIQNGIYRHSSEDNGFPDTNEYLLFTTRNGALSSPINIEEGENSSLVLIFEPRKVYEGLGLAAEVRHTKFLY